MRRVAAESILQDILKPINENVERVAVKDVTFESFVEVVYLPVYRRKWKGSTAMTEVDRLRFHLVGELGGKRMRAITREELQALLDSTAKECGRSVVDHLRFRL